MPAAAWRLGITYPQSIKRLGHFLTADCKSAGTPNGGQDISGATDFVFSGWYIRLSSARRSTPLGAPTDLQSVVKKGSTY